ncbi:MAG: hypothetical protein GY856_53075 [bacterium]|nr:hypothetical protein [bacterium]
MDETEAERYALAHVVRTLTFVYFTFDRPARRNALRGFPEQDRLGIENAVDEVMSVLVQRREQEPSPEELEEGFPTIEVLAACRPPPGRTSECWLPKSIVNPQIAERYVNDHFASTLHKLYARPESIATVSAVEGRSAADGTLIYRAVLRLMYWLQDRAGTMTWDRRSRTVRFDMPWAKIEYQVLDTVADRLGELYQPNATRLADCRSQLTAGLADLADLAGAREMALNLEVRAGGR